LKTRLLDHNDGRSVHTKKYKPWKLEVYVPLQTRPRAIAFEKYLKSGSGRAFAKLHFR